MSQTVTLLTGTRLLLGHTVVELAGGVSVIFPLANSVDEVAEILATSAQVNPSVAAQMVSNLRINEATFERQIVATANENAGYDVGTALDITYGPRGEKLYTTRGVPPALIPATTTIEDATDTIVTANFTSNVNSLLNDYKVGFSCKVAGVARTISSAARQADHKQIKFTLASAVTVGQAVLISFDSTLSDLKSDTGAKVQSFTDSVVTNNVV